MSFGLYQQLNPPTGVEHCLWAQFTSSTEKQLVIARNTIIQVYALSHVCGGFEYRSALRLVESYQLAGCILSLNLIKYSRAKMANNLDALLLTFEHGKISLVEFDFTRPSMLRTVALFDFRTVTAASIVSNNCGRLSQVSRNIYNTAVVDSNYSTIAVLLNETELAIISLSASLRRHGSNTYTKDLDILAQNDVHDLSHDCTNSRVHIAQVSQTASASLDTAKGLRLFRTPFVVSLNLFGIREGSIRHFSFLPGYTDPTILILHSGERDNYPMTSSGRLSLSRSTCTCTAFSLPSTYRRGTTLLWSIGSLPHDSMFVVPIPSAVEYGGSPHRNGALLISSNAIMHISPPYSSASCSVAFNSYACITLRPDHFSADMRVVCNNIFGRAAQNTKSHASLQLDSVKWTWVGYNQLLLCLRQGQLVIISIAQNSLSLRLSFSAKLIGKGHELSCLSSIKCSGTNHTKPDLHCRHFFIFMGATSSESILVKYFDPDSNNITHTPMRVTWHVKKTNPKDTDFHLGLSSSAASTDSKRRKLAYRSSVMVSFDWQHSLLSERTYEYDTLLYSRHFPIYRKSVETKNHENREPVMSMIDSLPSCGPITDLCVGEAVNMTQLKKKNIADVDAGDILLRAEVEASAFTKRGMFSAAAAVRERAKAEVSEERSKNAQAESKQTRSVLYASCGHGSFGGVRSISNNIRSDVHAELELHGCIGAWSFPDPLDPAGKRAFVAVSTIHETRILSGPSENSKDATSTCTGFVLDEPTLFASGITAVASHFSETAKRVFLVIQLLQTKLRVLDGGKCVWCSTINDIRACARVPTNNSSIDAHVMSCSVANGHILLGMNDSCFVLLTAKVSSSNRSLNVTQCFISALLHSSGIPNAPINAARLAPIPRDCRIDFLPPNFYKRGHNGYNEYIGTESDVMCALCRGGYVANLRGIFELHLFTINGESVSTELIFRSCSSLTNGDLILENSLCRASSLHRFCDQPPKTCDQFDDSFLILDLAVVSAGTTNITARDSELYYRKQVFIPSCLCLVVVLNNSDILLYRFRNRSHDMTVNLQLERISHNVITRRFRLNESKDSHIDMRSKVADIMRSAGHKIAAQFRFQLIFSSVSSCQRSNFSHINGWRVGIVAGECPVIILSSRGSIRLLPLDFGMKNACADAASLQSLPSVGEKHRGSVQYFAPVSNFVGIKHGFICYISTKVLATTNPNPLIKFPGTLCLCSLPPPEALQGGGTSPVSLEQARTDGHSGGLYSNIEQPPLTLDHEGLPMLEFPLRCTVHQFNFLGITFEADRCSDNVCSLPCFAVLSSRTDSACPLPLLYNEDGSKRTPENPNVVFPSSSLAMMATEKKLRLDGVDWNYVTRRDLFNQQNIETLPDVSIPHFSVQLYSSCWGGKGCLQSVPLLPNERGLCIECVRLNTSLSRRDNTWARYVAVGTSIMTLEGEDRTHEGRVLLFKIERVHSSLRINTHTSDRSFAYPKLSLASEIYFEFV